MSEKLEPATSNQSISSAEGSRVPQPRALDSEKAQTTNGGSGLSSTGLFASLNPDGSWRKTQPDCCLWGMDGRSVEYSGTWPKRGTMRSGHVCRLVPLVHVTREIESLLLPTPNCWDAKRGAESRKTKMARASGGVNLREAIKHWLGPTALECVRAVGKTGAYGMIAIGRNVDVTTHGTNQMTQTSVGGRLNPTWLEWLMGLPMLWTELVPLETQSCPRSRNGSDG